MKRNCCSILQRRTTDVDDIRNVMPLSDSAHGSDSCLILNSESLVYIPLWSDFIQRALVRCGKPFCESNIL